jgi:protein-tyrosine-phosphatase
VIILLISLYVIVQNLLVGDEMSKVLFVCVHNSARSQMAEELLRKYGEGSFVVESAGLEPGVLNPLAIEVLKEEGIDISDKKPNQFLNFLKQAIFIAMLLLFAMKAKHKIVLYFLVKQVESTGVLKTLVVLKAHGKRS